MMSVFEILSTLEKTLQGYYLVKYTNCSFLIALFQKAKKKKKMLFVTRNFVIIINLFNFYIFKIYKLLN